MKHKTLRTLLCVILTVCFCLSAIVPASAAGLFGGDSGAATGWDQLIRGLKDLKDRIIEKNPGTDETPAEPMTGTGTDGFYRIVHLDCGRKYFSKDWIIALLYEMQNAGYNQLQLAFGNDGLRFLLNDMSFTANGTTYSHKTVVSKVEAGNKAQNSSGDGRWLTETEMNDIVAKADELGIEIVPLLNLPGHANAILDIADDKYNASGSNNTLNVANGENSEAANFGYELFKKYVDYFAGKGCKFFNFGADEYANDALGTFSFSRLNAEQYQNFTRFIAKLTDYIEKNKMTARSFNDGLYYSGQSVAADAKDTIKRIQCCYWSSGWGSYPVAGAKTISNNGHAMINTHGDYYYVLGKSDNFDSGYSYANNFDNTVFPGENAKISNPVGSMFCIWCDFPNAETKTEVAQKTRLVLRAMAQKMKGEALNVTEEVVANGFNADGSINTGSVTPEPGENTQIPVNLTIGQTKTVTQDGDVTGQVGAVENTNIATVESVEYAQVSGGTERTLGGKITTLSSVTDKVVVSDGTNFLVVDSQGTISNTTDVKEATTFSIIVSNTDYYPYQFITDDGWYLSTVWSYDNTNYQYVYSLSTTQENSYITKWGYYDKGIYNNAYLYYNGKTWSLNSGTGNAYVYSIENTEAEPVYKTVITFKGVSKGTTSVTIGGVQYNINVTEENLSTVTPLTVEYWITNKPIYNAGATNQQVSATLANVNSEDGVEFTTIVPSVTTEKSDGSGTKYYIWKGTRLTSGNEQTSDNGVDQTAAGNDFYYIRYWNGVWSFSANRVEWKKFNSNDQIVAYYLQKTDVTKEVETYVKDWGYNTATETPDWSGGLGQVALTIAVVYPDGSVSPTEGNMYSKSTTIFHYESGGRDIGIIAPKNNSDYNIAKITVTDGTRDNNTSSNVWYSDDTITWKTKANEAGVEWYDEITVWDKVTNAGTTPMVNGKPGTTTTDGIIWSAKNTAKLVLIYLEAKPTEDSLKHVYWDDNADKQITENAVLVKNIQDQPPVTFINSLRQGGTVIGGTHSWPSETPENDGYFPDDAYIVNSSGVEQTFNKKLSTVQNIPKVYKSGIYKYVSADISEDGKTLTFHYDLKTTNNTYTFVVDFGLPIKITPKDIGITSEEGLGSAYLEKTTQLTANTGEYGRVEIHNEGNKFKYLTYTLNKPLDKKAAIPLFIDLGNEGERTEFTANIIPATNVYYEENFINVAENSTVWTDTSTARNPDQALEKSDAQKYVYGYDPVYATATDMYSMGNAKKATLTLSADAFSTKTSEALTFTFEGDGYDIISECGTDVGLLVAYTYRVENGKETLKYIDIMDNYFCGDDTYIIGNGILAAQVPVIRKLNLSDGYGKYKVKIIGYLRQTAGVLNVSDSMATQSYAAMASVDSPVVYDYESSTNAIVDEILADLGVANLADVDVRVSFVDKNSILNGGTGVFAKETVQDMKNDLRSAYTVQANEGYKAGSAVVYVDAFRVYNPLGHDTTNLPTAYSDANENDMRYDSVYEYVSASGADIGDEYIENSAVYVEYDGNKGIATISEYKKQGPENEVYLTANGSKEQHFIGFVINGWEGLANRKLIVSAKIVSGEPSLVTLDAGSNEHVVAVSEFPEDNQKQLSKTEQYFDLTDHVIKRDGKWVLIIGNKSGVSSVLSISGIRIKNNCTAGTTLEDVNIITGIISSESAADFTPVKFSETHKSKVRVNKSAYISINASDDVTSFKLYAVDGNTKTEVTDDFTYAWTNQKAFNAGRTDIKSYSAYVKVGATAGEKKYELVAVNADGIESNPIEITITVVQ